MQPDFSRSLLVPKKKRTGVASSLRPCLWLILQAGFLFYDGFDRVWLL